MLITGNPKVRIENVTPKLALATLERNTFNRSIADTTVARYARIMKAGEWGLSPDAICLATDSSVINGQHRLWAVVLSDTTQPFILLGGMDPNSRVYVDTLRPRSPSDTMKIHMPELGLRPDDIAVIKAFYSSFPSGAHHNLAWPVPVLERGAQKILPALTFIQEVFSSTRKGGIASPVKGCVARAFFHVDRDRLARFVQVLRSGEQADGSEVAAVKLRKMLVEGSLYRKLVPHAAYQFCQSAIRAFLEQRAVQLLKACEIDLFPVKEEQLLKAEDITQTLGIGGRSGRLNRLQATILKGELVQQDLLEMQELITDNGDSPL